MTLAIETDVGEKRIAELMGWTWRIELPDAMHWCKYGFDRGMGSWLKPGGRTLHDWQCVSCDRWGNLTYPRYRGNLKELNSAAKKIVGVFYLKWTGGEWKAWDSNPRITSVGRGATEEEAMWEMIHKALDNPKENADANAI